jgi:hypothetical protein
MLPTEELRLNPYYSLLSIGRIPFAPTTPYFLLKNLLLFYFLSFSRLPTPDSRLPTSYLLRLSC